MKNVIEGIVDSNNANYVEMKKNPNALLVSGTTLRAISSKVLPKRHKDILSKQNEKILEIDDTPLVKADPTNAFVQAASAIAGFDVTQRTPVENIENERELNEIPKIVPVTVDTPVVEVETKSIEEDDVRSAIDTQVVTPQEPRIDYSQPVLQTPQEFETPVSKPDPYVALNIKVEEIRNKYQKSLEDLRNDTNRRLEDLKEKLNKDFDELSRGVESMRISNQSDLESIKTSLDDQFNMYNQDLYNQGISNAR